MKIIVFIIAFSSVFTNNFFQENNNANPVLIVLEDKQRVDFSIRKRSVPLSPLEIFLRLCIKTILHHLFQSLLLSYLVLCTPFEEYAIWVAPNLFFLFSARTFLIFIQGVYSMKKLTKLIEYYDKFLDFLCVMIIGISMCFILAESVAWLVRYAQLGDKSLFTLVPMCLRREHQGGEWVEKYRCEDIVIEENEQCYRITIGGHHWEIYKLNPFDIKVFSVLLATVKNEKGQPVLSTRKLAKAFGFSAHDLLNRLVLRCKRAGDTLTALISGDRKGYQGKIRAEVMKLLKENASLSLIEIRDRLLELGWAKVTIGQITTALSKIDFNQIRKDIRRQLLQSNTDSEDDPLVKIEKNDNIYRIFWDNVHWDISCDNRFDLSSLLHFLTSARNQDGRPIVSIKAIAGMLQFNSYNAVRKMINATRYVAQRYRGLKVGNKRLCNQQHDQKLRKIILDLWEEDITLNGKQICERLNQLGEQVSYAKLRDLMRNVDFWSLRLRLAKGFQKNEYRKSTQWVIDKQRELIESLIEKLKQGKTYTPAQIIQFVAEIPKTVLPPKEEEKKQPGDVGWLKCFLFNLPRKMDGKIACPKCGQFNTARKSRIPSVQTIMDEETGATRSVNTYRFYCKNSQCSTGSFSATPDGSHILQEQRYAKICLMLRMLMGLNGSYRSIANLLGTCKSFVYDELTLLSYMVDHWTEILGAVRFSGTLCIDEKYVKIRAFKKTKKRPFGYLIFAVDPLTYDLLHIEIFEARDHLAAKTFLLQLKAKGIYPKTIMTDLADTYDKPVREVYGRSVTLARCFFHFKKNIFDHMNKQFGKKNIPQIAKQLKQEIFDIVDAKSRKTIKKRDEALQKKKEEYLAKESRLLPMFNCLENYLPHLLRTVENPKVSIRTNNPCEQVIRHFNQRYKTMSGFANLDTARRHAHLFQIVYRFTPFSQDARDESKRGLAPLQLAGYQIEHMPLFKYLTQPLLFNIQPAKNLALLLDQAA